jgi:hypothetical protein
MRCRILAAILVVVGCTTADVDQPSPEQIAELEARVAAAERAAEARHRRPFATDRAACDRFIELAESEGMFVGPEADEFRELAWLDCAVEASQVSRDYSDAKATIIHDCVARASESSHIRACYRVLEYRSHRDEATLRRLVDCALTAANAEELDKCDT